MGKSIDLSQDDDMVHSLQIDADVASCKIMGVLFTNVTLFGTGMMCSVSFFKIN